MLHTKSIFIIVFMYTKIHAVPPEACFANFRWDDCGRPPQRVLYYWKPGSRCEVGTWRGCLPNINMFHDEYECVNTCIFTARAEPEDYHKVTEEDVQDEITETVEAVNVTSSDSDANITTSDVAIETNATVSDASNSTDVVETNATATVETNATVTEENATTPADGNATIPSDGDATIPSDGNSTATNSTT